MQSHRNYLKSCAALLLLGVILSPTARGADDVLYIGDGSDDTIKSFDAISGAYLGTSDGPGVSGLAGPRGVIISGGELLVVNQNVGLDISGEVLRFNVSTGEFAGALIPSTDLNAPFAPDGIVLGPGYGDIFVANVLRKANVTPGRVDQYALDGTFLAELKVKNNEHHPRGAVFGPDGLLYVSARDFKGIGIGGTVLRYSADGKAEVLIDDKGGPGRLNRPDGLVFGPDGRLYITSFRADLTDTDSIRIYESTGEFVSKIDLYDVATQDRAYAQALLFGPGGKLYVPISNTGDVRRYNTPTTGDFSVLVPSGGHLGNPWYMTFGHTNPSTLTYDEPG
jgi:hypothetical protein